jgi:uncharacterized integral membrane protein
MKFLTWAIRLVIFLFLFAFALRNTDPVILHTLPGQDWQAPQVIILLVFFVAGALLGVFSPLGLVLRQRREISRLNRLSSPNDIPLPPTA